MVKTDLNTQVPTNIGVFECLQNWIYPRNYSFENFKYNNLYVFVFSIFSIKAEINLYGKVQKTKHPCTYLDLLEISSLLIYKY